MLRWLFGRAPKRPAPDQVALYGLGYYTLTILELCQAAGLRAVFAVDDRPEVPGTPSVDLTHLRKRLRACNVPIVTVAKFATAWRRQQPMILAADIENDMASPLADDAYLRNALLVRERTGQRLLHPVVLADAVPLPAYRGRVALFGFPGSGNILAQHLVGDILRRVDSPVPTPVQAIANFAEHYYVSTVALIRHLLGQLRPLGLELIPVDFPTCNLTVSLPDEQSAVALHIPSNRHLSAYFYATHAIPTSVAVDAFTHLGAPCVAVIRHPCETILSWASKMSRPPTPVLADRQFFVATAAGLAKWYRHLIAGEGRVLLLRYEDLTARQARPLQLLAERLGVNLSAAEIEAMYDRYLHRDLLPGNHPGHYYRGGNEKWKQHFLPWHMEELQAQGVASVCAHLGYDLTPPVQQSGNARQGTGGPSGQKVGVVPVGRLMGHEAGILKDRPYPLIVTSESPAVTRALAAALHGADFLEHLNAGGLGPDPPSWVRPIPWPTLASIFLVEKRPHKNNPLQLQYRFRDNITRAPIPLALYLNVVLNVQQPGLPVQQQAAAFIDQAGGLVGCSFAFPASGEWNVQFICYDANGRPLAGDMMEVSVADNVDGLSSSPAPY